MSNVWWMGLIKNYLVFLLCCFFQTLKMSVIAWSAWCNLVFKPRIHVFFLVKQRAWGSSILVGKKREAAAPPFWLSAIINHNLPFPDRTENYLREFAWPQKFQFTYPLAQRPCLWRHFSFLKLLGGCRSQSWGFKGQEEWVLLSYPLAEVEIQLSVFK